MGKSVQAEIQPMSKAEAFVDSDEIEQPDEAALASIEADTEVVQKASQRSVRGGGDTMLSLYFRDMACYRVLRREEEVAAAQEVEELERKYWLALLAYPPAFEAIHTVLEGLTPEDPPEQLAELRKLAAQALSSRFGKKSQEQWDMLAHPLACKLRAVDTDRLFVEGAFASVQRLAGRHSSERDLIGGAVQLTPAFRNYLACVEASRRAQKQAKNRFVLANLRLVVSIARRYHRSRMPLIDLVQEGNIGLMKAVERFDHARGYRFSTYAAWWIRHAITRALADKSRAVRLPVHMLDTVSRIQKATHAITARTGTDASSEEIGKETGIPEDKLSMILSYMAETPFSLDRPVNDEDGSKFVDLLESEDTPSPDDTLVRQAWSAELRRLLPTLSPMEQRILRWRFGLDDGEELTLKEIGDKYNLTRERIRQLQEQALAKIRTRFRD